jgi:hypothetical protein
MQRRIVRQGRATPNYCESKAKELLQSIAKCDESMAHLSSVRQEQYDKLSKMMMDAKVINVEVDGNVADIISEMGNAQNTIDPVKFYKAVQDEKDFFGCISVSVTKARSVLPERLLEKITVHTPGVSKGKRLVIWKKGVGKKPRGV